MNHTMVCAALCLAFSAAAFPAVAESAPGDEGGVSAPQGASSPGGEDEVGITENLGVSLPSGLMFSDETGTPVDLAVLITQPTILTLVYYRCAGLCNPLLGGVAEAVDEMDMVPGTDYSVISVSFDPTENPDMAARKKKNYLKHMTRPFPPGAWRFLTGSAATITALLSSVGFHIKKDGEEFLHPVAMIIVSPGGRIVRYMEGITFNPVTVKTALIEASRGRIGPTLRKVLSLCYSRDPRGKVIVSTALKVFGAALIAGVALFVGYLAGSGRPRAGGAG